MYLLHNFSPDVLCIDQIWAYFIKMGSNFLENVIKLDCLTPQDLYYYILYSILLRPGRVQGRIQAQQARKDKLLSPTLQALIWSNFVIKLDSLTPHDLYVHTMQYLAKASHGLGQSRHSRQEKRNSVTPYRRLLDPNFVQY